MQKEKRNKGGYRAIIIINKRLTQNNAHLPSIAGITQNKIMKWMAQLAILQSLMDQPSEPENKIPTLPAAIEECEAQIKQSKQAAEELVDT